MQARQLYKEIDVRVVSIDAAGSLLHKHHFFQMIYIMEGSGFHIINGNRFPFERENVFLLSPGDSHSYIASGTPVLCLIEFTSSFFNKSASHNGEAKIDYGHVFDHLTRIFRHQHHVKGNLLPQNDKLIFDVLIRQLITETEGQNTASTIIIQNILFLLLNFIARNIVQQPAIPAQGNSPSDVVHHVASYIQQHIFENKKLSIDALALQFNASQGNLSRHFKQETGITIKDYITRCKLDIIQVRLEASNLTISEIAAEMSFTDESHLNKIFKKAFGITATQFRKTVRNRRR